MLKHFYLWIKLKKRDGKFAFYLKKTRFSLKMRGAG
jgi:hypothetical protein